KKADKAAEFEHREAVENVLIKRLIGLPLEPVEVKGAPKNHRVHASSTGHRHRGGPATPHAACMARPSCIKQPSTAPRPPQPESATPRRSRPCSGTAPTMQSGSARSTRASASWAWRR